MIIGVQIALGAFRSDEDLIQNCNKNSEQVSLGYKDIHCYLIRDS